jgi:hypothetical protein
MNSVSIFVQTINGMHLNETVSLTQNYIQKCYHNLISTQIHSLFVWLILQ